MCLKFCSGTAGIETHLSRRDDPELFGQLYRLLPGRQHLSTGNVPDVWHPAVRVRPSGGDDDHRLPRLPQPQGLHRGHCGQRDRPHLTTGGRQQRDKKQLQKVIPALDPQRGTRQGCSHQKVN